MRTRGLVVILTVAAALGAAPQSSCKPWVVSCNYAHLYTGSVSIQSINRVPNPDHQVRHTEDVTVSIDPTGRVQCTGSRTESESHGYRGTLDHTSSGSGIIGGPGLLAIEFLRDSLGALVYAISYACPTPDMTFTSTNARTGVTETTQTSAAPVDSNTFARAADPHRATTIAMATLKGSQVYHHSISAGDPADGTITVTWLFTKK